MPDESELRDMMIVPRFAPRVKPTPIPSANAFDEPTRCIKINVEWVSHLLGVCEALDQPDTWIGDEEQIFAARQNVREIMLALMTSNCEDTEEPMPPEMRIVDGVLEWRPDSESDWIELGNVQGEDGAPGAPGEDGEDGQDGDCECGAAPERDPEDQGDGWRCGVAIAVTKHIREIWNKAYADSDGVIAGLSTGASTVLGVAAFLFPGIAVAAGIAVALIGGLNALLALDQLEVDAFDDEAEERYRCMLYCLLEDDANLTPEIVTTWIDLISADTPNPHVSALVLMLQGTPFDDLQWVAWAASEVSTEACDCDCPEEPTEWCYEFDFTSDDGGWSGAYGSWSSSGWSGTAAGTGVSIVLERVVSTTTITHIEMDVEAPGQCNVQVNVDGVGTLSFIGVSSGTHTWDGSQSGTNILLNPSSGAVQGASVTMTRLLLQGTGTNPFGSDNC